MLVIAEWPYFRTTDPAPDGGYRQAKAFSNISQGTLGELISGQFKKKIACRSLRSLLAITVVGGALGIVGQGSG
jgi:hypothetical protein